MPPKPCWALSCDELLRGVHGIPWVTAPPPVRRSLPDPSLAALLAQKAQWRQGLSANRLHRAAIGTTLKVSLPFDYEPPVVQFLSYQNFRSGLRSLFFSFFCPDTARKQKRQLLLIRFLFVCIVCAIPHLGGFEWETGLTRVQSLIFLNVS